MLPNSKELVADAYEILEVLDVRVGAAANNLVQENVCRSPVSRFRMEFVFEIDSLHKVIPSARRPKPTEVDSSTEVWRETEECKTEP
jgi:hypothetical protein